MIDLVHDIAYSYRELVYCVSYPGRVKNIMSYAVGADFTESIYSPTLILAYMLLDSEVSFCVLGDDENNTNGKLISKLTYCKQKDVSEADYIFVLENASNASVDLQKARIGDLVDPHNSATVIIEQSENMAMKNYELSGPGVGGVKDCSIACFEGGIELFNKKNAEFPMGIDFFFVSEFGNIMVLPRTCKLREV